MRRVLRVAEAAAALALARLAVRLLPFRWLAPAAAPPHAVPSSPVLSCSASSGAGGLDPRAARVGRAISGAAARLPWHSTCLARALAGRLMLARRGVPCVLCLGVATEAGAIRAHAWLVAGGGVVCGGREAPGYTAIAAFPTGGAP